MQSMKGYVTAGIMAVCGILLSQRSVAQSPAKKNLLFIITDQQRYDALGYAGNPVIQTPNLDSLARRGAYFRNAYTQCAVCGPARSSILTGYSVEGTGAYSNDQTYYYPDETIMPTPTFDEILAENGYHCEYYGKWHAMSSHAEVYKNPVQYADNGRSVFGPGGQTHIWRDYLGTLGQIPGPGTGEFIEGLSRYPYIANPIDRFYGMSWEELQNQGLSHSQPDQHGELQLNQEHTLTAFQARQTIEAIERLKDETFSITCSFHFPHSPMVVPDPYYGMYPVEEMIPPVSINDDMSNSPYKNSNSRNNRTEYADPDLIKYMISDYYGIVTEIDHWVGEIMKKLDELGIADNTMIVFTSDHGEMLGAHGMREKNVFYEESSHIPLLISNPGDIPSKTTVDGYVSHIDLFPTIMDYLGVTGQESQGTTLRGLIEGTDADHGQYVVTEWDRPNISNYMVVKDGWKLIIPYTITSTVINALYDLNTDPHEMNNLLGSNPDRAQYLDKAEELRACLLEWLEERNSVHYYSVSQRDLLVGGRPTGNDAEFVSQDIPELSAGETASVSITMKNTGTSAWTQTGQFKLGSQGPADNETWGLKRVLLDPEDHIMPGDEKTFTFSVTVPESDGVFNLQWQMVQDGEEWFGEKSEIEQVITGNPGSYMDDCDDLGDWNSSAGLILNTSDQQQGVGCIEFSGSNTDEFKKVFSRPYNTYGAEATTELSFWYYVSDVSVHEPQNQVEIGSAGKPDQDEYNWNLNGLTNGWNFLTLKTSEANKMGSPDLAAINWFRLYRKKTGEVTTRIDAIKLIDTNVGPLYTLLVDGGQGGGNYPEGSEVTISADSPPSGQVFDQWIIESGSPTIADMHSSPTILTMAAGPALVSSSYSDEVTVEDIMAGERVVHMYPNPAETELFISISTRKKASIVVSILDMSGRIIRKSEAGVCLPPGNEDMRISLTGLVAGTYFIQVNMNDHTFSKLLLIK
jgi:arylsulfatase A-like enzyme